MENFTILLMALVLSLTVVLWIILRRAIDISFSFSIFNKYSKKDMSDFARWAIHSGQCSQSVSDLDINNWEKSRK